MKIYIVKETTIDEKRVSLVPDVAKKFIKDGFDVFLEKDAGYMSKFTDEDYSSLGVNIFLGLIVSSFEDSNRIFFSDS